MKVGPWLTLIYAMVAKFVSMMTIPSYLDIIEPSCFRISNCPINFKMLAAIYNYLFSYLKENIKTIEIRSNLNERSDQHNSHFLNNGQMKYVHVFAFVKYIVYINNLCFAANGHLT
jgi:hypothetical protein